MHNKVLAFSNRWRHRQQDSSNSGATWSVDTISGSDWVNHHSPDMGPSSCGCPSSSSLAQLSVLCFSFVFSAQNLAGPGHRPAQSQPLPVPRDYYLTVQHLGSGPLATGSEFWVAMDQWEHRFGELLTNQRLRIWIFGWPVTNEGNGVSLGMWWWFSVSPWLL